MKGGTLQINWHNTKPVLTLDFHPFSGLLATAGADFDIKVEVEVDVAAGAGAPKTRTFKKFSFRGVDLDALLHMSTDDLVKLFTARARRRFQRGLKRKPMALIKKLRKAAFFRRWWLLQSVEIHAAVKKLVAAGQLEFVNGGWCMHDEAATHYIDMIDQTTLGHALIKFNFNVTPRAGWQIDPFGHSAVQAYLLGAELGFDSLHFARIDYQDRAQRKDDKSLEVIWRGSKTFGSSSQIFTNAFPKHYSAPGGFNFEVSGDFEPVQDEPLLFDNNVQKRINDFIDAALTQAARQLEYLAGRRTRGPDTFSLGDALGIAQHHDAVTGTAKQHTTNDYEKRLAIGALEAEAVVTSALSCLTSTTSNCTISTSIFSQCPLLNISYCPATENIPSGKNSVGLTPHEVFTKNHKILFSKGEEWMKETAAQLMVVASWIATISFAAAFTFPGGYDQVTGAKLCMVLEILGNSDSVNGVDVARHQLAACRTLIKKDTLGEL